MILISITGDICSGKTTIAQCLRHSLPGKTIILAENSSISGMRQAVLLKTNVDWVIFDGIPSERVIDVARDSNMKVVSVTGKSFK